MTALWVILVILVAAFFYLASRARAQKTKVYTIDQARSRAVRHTGQPRRS
ncbi:MAG: hypothetical protein WBQ50_14620 [Nocardioides sp.]